MGEADVATELMGLGGEEPGAGEAPHRPLRADPAEDGRLVDPEPRGDLPEGAVVQDACLDDDAVGEVEAAGLPAPRRVRLPLHSRLLSEAWEGDPSMAQAQRADVAFPVSLNGVMVLGV